MAQPIVISKELLLRMRVPKLHWFAKLSEIPDSCKHKTYIERYIANMQSNLREGKGLFLYGDYSTGKSAISCILLKAAASMGRTGLFVRASQIVRAVIDKTPFDDRVTLVDRMNQVDLLVIDELIVQGDSKFGEYLIEDIVRERISQQKSLIVTSNQTPAVVKEKYPALACVMSEALLMVPVKGHNFREQLKNELKDELEGSDNEN